MRLALALVATLLAPPPVGPSAKVPLQAFPLRDVRLLDGPFRDMQQRGLAHLVALDPDRLLHTFRLNAGLPTTAKPYGAGRRPRSSCAVTASGTT